jgi:hypothetical protein
MGAASMAFGFRGLPVLEQTPATLRNILSAATKDDMNWVPSRGRWSITMVLAHLADVELNGFVRRFRAIAEEENPSLPAYNQLALFESGARFDGREELERFERRRSDTLAWLKALPRDVEYRLGRHEELGVISFGQLLNEFAFHDLGHIRQIAEVYRSRAFYPNMGVFQNYYTIHP